MAHGKCSVKVTYHCYDRSLTDYLLKAWCKLIPTLPESPPCRRLTLLNSGKVHVKRRKPQQRIITCNKWNWNGFGANKCGQIRRPLRRCCFLATICKAELTGFLQPLSFFSEFHGVLKLYLVFLFLKFYFCRFFFQAVEHIQQPLIEQLKKKIG